MLTHLAHPTSYSELHFEFEPAIFEILPGTVTEKPVPKAAKDTFEQEMLSIQSATD